MDSTVFVSGFFLLLVHVGSLMAILNIYKSYSESGMYFNYLHLKLILWYIELCISS